MGSSGTSGVRPLAVPARPLQIFGFFSACVPGRASADDGQHLPNDLSELELFITDSGSKLHLVRCSHTNHLSEEDVQKLQKKVCRECANTYKKELGKKKGA